MSDDQHVRLLREACDALMVEQRRIFREKPMSRRGGAMGHWQKRAEYLRNLAVRLADASRATDTPQGAEGAG